MRILVTLYNLEENVPSHVICNNNLFRALPLGKLYIFLLKGVGSWLFTLHKGIHIKQRICKMIRTKFPALFALNFQYLK